MERGDVTISAQLDPEYTPPHQLAYQQSGSVDSLPSCVSAPFLVKGAVLVPKVVKLESISPSGQMVMCTTWNIRFYLFCYPLEICFQLFH